MSSLLVADRIRTADRIVGDAVLIDGGHIVAIGRASDLAGDHELFEYPGATIVPGLVDAHLHPVGYTAALHRPSLKNAADFDDLVAILGDAASRLPAQAALSGVRLDDESLAEQQLPDRHVLDRVSVDRPILATRYCGHVAVANTAALDLVGIDRDTPDPPGGVIDRTPDGIPTGVLRETAFEPLAAALRPLTPPISVDDVVDALTALASTGLTKIGAIVAIDSGLWGSAGSELDLLLEAAPRSPIGISTYVVASDPRSLREAATQIEGASGPVSFGGVKMFSDGSFGGHTAAMHEPFADRPDELGTDRLDPGFARTMADTSLAIGGRVAIHAIGDRANGRMLDLMEELIAAGADPADLRIEHASVLTEADIVRFGRTGVTASVQPAFVASEVEWLQKRVGPGRVGRTYAFRSLIDAGARLAGGSDSPVEPPHPLHGIATARDRAGFTPEQALTGPEALALFTTDAAAACRWSAPLEAGAPADLTVLGVDPVSDDPSAVRSGDVLDTWVEGRRVDMGADVVAWND